MVLREDVVWTAPLAWQFSWSKPFKVTCLLVPPGVQTVIFPLSLHVPIFARDVGGVLEDRVRVPAFGITLIPYNM